MTSDFRMDDEQLLKEIRKYTDRVAVAVYRSEGATVLVSQLLPIADGDTGRRLTLKEYYPQGVKVSKEEEVIVDDWPEG